VSKRECTWPLKNCWTENGYKQNYRLNTPRGSGMHLQRGPFMKGPGINYTKRKKASSNSVKSPVQRMAFKGVDTLSAVKE
jgi:hypothetical protein